MTEKIRNRKRRSDSRYRPKYARALREGAREKGETVPEICKLWGITEGMYKTWLQTEPKFKEAHDRSETDFKAFWGKVYREGAIGDREVDAGLLKHISKTVLGYHDKVEVKHTQEDTPRAITINILPPPKELPKLENNIIEGEIIEDAVESGDLTNTKSS